MSKPSRKNRSKKTDQVHEESLTIKDGVDELEQEGDGNYVTKAYVYVVVNFLFQVIFLFLLFLGMVIYANEVETTEKEKLPEIKN